MLRMEGRVDKHGSRGESGACCILIVQPGSRKGAGMVWTMAVVSKPVIGAKSGKSLVLSSPTATNKAMNRMSEITW